MLVIVQTPFVGHGFNMPNPGDLIEVSDEVARHLMGMGAVLPYETKVQPLPPETKKKPTQSGSSQAAPAPRKKTRKSSKKSAKK